jgi:hypothetical protein
MTSAYNPQPNLPMLKNKQRDTRALSQLRQHPKNLAKFYPGSIQDVGLASETNKGRNLLQSLT